MEKFKELLEKLKALKITQSEEWDESIPADIWNEYFEDQFKIVADEIDIDKHRWYETSVVVLDLHGGFIGIRNVSNVFSESMGIEDCEHELSFFEMKPVQTTTYIKA